MSTNSKLFNPGHPPTTDRLCMTLTTIIFCLTVIGLQAPNASPQARQEAADEQSAFGSDSELDRAVPIPRTAMDIVRSVLHRSADELPDKLFEASEIHLDGPSEVDLVVLVHVASHGAHFLMLRPTSDGYSVILNSGGDSLKVLRSKSNGYRSIAIQGFSQAGKVTTNALFRFNGQQYIEASEKTRPTNVVGFPHD